MKHYRYFISLLGAITLMTACDFLDVVPDDAPTIEDAFKNRAAAEKALFTCYSFLPDPTNPYDYPAYFTSHDEFEIGSMHWDCRNCGVCHSERAAECQQSQTELLADNVSGDPLLQHLSGRNRHAPGYSGI